MDDSVYLRIAQRLDRGPLGAPKSGQEISKAFLAFLELVYTPEQAQIVEHLQMPYKFMTAAQVAEASGGKEDEVKKILETISQRCAILGVNNMYCLPLIPMLLNNHQFYAEMKQDDLQAAKLYQQFFIKEGFYKYYESGEKGTPIMRVIPVQRAIEASQKILNTEEAHKIIESCANIAMVPCPCRTRTEKLGTRECRDRNPIGACLMLNMSALYFEKAGLGKMVDADQAITYFDQMQDLGLVGITENYQNNSNHEVICLCCECCCSQLRGRTRWENPLAVAPSNFVAEANDDCILCGKCEDRCFFGAISQDEKLSRAIADPDKCIGCGVCTITCEQDALRLKRVERAQTFADSRELYKKISIENKGERR